ncbi:hypothetical protein XENOCAPTIV_016620, partial [Xenoophorus captivus]
AGRLASDQEYRRDALSASGRYHLTSDMIHLVAAKNAQALASDQDYRKRLHEYTVLPDDMKVKWAKKAYNLQSETKYRQLPDRIKFTSVADSPDIVHAKTSYQQCSEESHLKEKGQQVGLRCVEDDPKMVHSLAASKLQSNLEYKRQSKEEHAHYNIRPDQPEFLLAKKSQAQASDITYRRKLHDYTCDPEQLTVRHAKQAYKLQSDVRHFPTQSFKSQCSTFIIKGVLS